ncbi:MAG: diversity-generating retroelement protein Avd [Cyanobacteria bacterium P01_A01_bin.37]
MQQELPVIQKTYDLIRWYVPIFNRLPKDHRFGLGERMTKTLYELLEGLIQARYSRKEKLSRLQFLNTHLDILCYQTRLLLDFELISLDRYDYAGQQLRSVGQDLGGWIKSMRQKTADRRPDTEATI